MSSGVDQEGFKMNYAATTFFLDEQAFYII